MKKLVILLLLVGLGGGFWAYESWKAEQEQLHRDYIELYGNVEIRRVNLSFRVFGRISKIFFEEGDIIRKGDVLASLDRQPYEENLAVVVATKDKAIAELEYLENGERPQEIEQSRATLDENRASLKVLEADFKRFQELRNRNATTENEYETSLARRDEAAARVRHAEETLDLLIEGARKEKIEAARAQLNQAAATVAQAQTMLSDSEIIAPNDGVLLTRIEEPGAVVQQGQTVATLSLKGAVWVYVYIPEPELGKITAGMKAEVITDSRQDKVYIGQIGYISPRAEFTPKNVETPQLRTDLVFRVRIIVDAPDDGLLQGMPVTVRIKPGTNLPEAG